MNADGRKRASARAQVAREPVEIARPRVPAHGDGASSFRNAIPNAPKTSSGS